MNEKINWKMYVTERLIFFGLKILALAKKISPKMFDAVLAVLEEHSGTIEP